MAVVYRQIATTSEWRRGTFSLRLSVSDDYASLFQSPPDVDERTVGCVRVSSFKQDLEDDEGKFVEDELTVEVDSIACRTAHERDVLDLILEAVDPDLERYILLEIAEGGSSTYKQLFRGVFRPEVQAQDTQWSGAEYGTDPTPERQYKFAAKSYSVAVVERDLGALVPAGPTDTLDPLWPVWSDFIYSVSPPKVRSWLASSGAYSLNFGGSIVDFSAVYFPDLVDLNDVLRYYADRIEEAVGDPSFSIQFAESPIAMTFGTPNLRYVNNFPRGPEYFGDLAPAVEHRTTQSRNDLALGDGQEGPLVSLRLMQPVREDSLAFSFLRYKTFDKLCYGIARALGMFSTFEYDDDGNLIISFRSRENIFKDAAGAVKRTYVRDVTSGSIKSKPTVVNAKKERYYGFVNQYVLEGTDTFSREPSIVDNFDEGRYVGSELSKSLGTPDKLLALTIGVQMMDTYEPFYGTRYRKIWNTNPWVGDHASTDPPPSFPITTGIGLGQDRYMMTTGLYVRTEDEIYYASTGGAPADTGRRYDSVRPVTQVDVEIDGEQESFTELAEYVNRLKGIDGKYFDTEYELQVPYLSAFRRTPDGADSIFNLDLGSTITIDGVDYVAVGREIDFVGMSTKIRLHALTRFSVFGHPTAVIDADIGSGSTDPDDGGEQRRNVESFTAAENITAGWAVSVNNSGQIVKALPVAGQYNRVVGVALTTTSAGSVAQVCTSGVCSVPDTYDVGRALWLRAGSPNLSTDRIGTPATTEHVDQKIGTCVGAGAIEVNIGRPFIWYGWGN